MKGASKKRKDETFDGTLFFLMIAGIWFCSSEILVTVVSF